MKLLVASLFLCMWVEAQDWQKTTRAELLYSPIPVPAWRVPEADATLGILFDQTANVAAKVGVECAAKELIVYKGDDFTNLDVLWKLFIDEVGYQGLWLNTEWQSTEDIIVGLFWVRQEHYMDVMYAAIFRENRLAISLCQLSEFYGR